MSGDSVDSLGLGSAVRAAERLSRKVQEPPRADRSHRPMLRHRELGEALRTLGRVFDTLETCGPSLCKRTNIFRFLAI